MDRATIALFVGMIVGCAIVLISIWITDMLRYRR